MGPGKEKIKLKNGIFDNIEPSDPVHQFLIAIIVIVSIVATVYLDTLLLGDGFTIDKWYDCLPHLMVGLLVYVIISTILFVVVNALAPTPKVRKISNTEFEVKGIEYHIIDEDTVELSRKGEYFSSFNASDLNISEYVSYHGEDYRVTKIGKRAFLECRGLTSVVIPDSVTEIGEGAFGRCISIKKITITKRDTVIRKRS